MAPLTSEQIKEVESLRELLVEARTRLERINLVNPIASIVWARLSNAHAALGNILEEERIHQKSRSSATGL